LSDPIEKKRVPSGPIPVDGLFISRERHRTVLSDQIIKTREKKDLPLSDDSEVILDALVVDILVLLKVGHLDLAGRRSNSSLRERAEGCLDGSRLFFMQDSR
jgi:hypothetical protein